MVENHDAIFFNLNADGYCIFFCKKIICHRFVIPNMIKLINNNNLNNLIILNRSHHACLHRILEKNWSLLSKDNSSNLENCWNILRDQLTTAYLEINSANVIKITDIGRSAAEPLNSNNIYIYLLNI